MLTRNSNKSLFLTLLVEKGHELKPEKCVHFKMLFI